jgi:glycosyltransferase involved in cell wall biosynthesis
MQNNKKRVAIIGTNGVPASYGGFETLVEYLTKELRNEFDFTVYCSSIYKKKERLESYNKSKLIYLPLKANGFQSILYDIISTFHAWFKSDILLILGPAAGFILPLNIFFKKKIITNHGGLNEWEREKLSFFQRKYAYINHKIAGLNSNENIADNIPLKKSLYKSFGVSTNVIEYGGDHINIEEIPSKLLKKYSFLSNSYSLCVARAQIDNNLHLLIETFKELPNNILVIISNWNISNYGKELCKKYQGISNVFLIPAVYDKYDLDVIRSNTELYIHSHSQCGTSPSLVEAMNYNIPIICYDVETNRETTEHKSFYFNDSSSLMSLIKNLSLDNRIELKKNMYNLAKKKYTWKNIANKYANLISKQ